MTRRLCVVAVALLACCALLWTASGPVLIARSECATIMGGVEPCYEAVSVNCGLVNPQTCNPNNCTSINDPDDCCDSMHVCIESGGQYNDAQNTWYESTAETLDGGTTDESDLATEYCWNVHDCRTNNCVLSGSKWRCRKGTLQSEGDPVYPSVPSGSTCESDPETPDDP